MPPSGLVAHPSRRLRLQEVASRHPLWLVALGVVVYATGPVLVQASDASGPVFSFWRLWLGVPVLALLSWFHVRGGGRWPDRRAWRWCAWAGLAFGAHQLLFFTAIKATSVADVSLMNTLAPIVVAAVAVPLFGERPGLRFRLWTLLAIAGAAVVVMGASTGPQGDPWGMAMAVANVFGFAAFFLISKHARDEIDVMPFLFGTMTVAALTASLYTLVAGEPVAGITQRDLWLAIVTALGPGVLGHFVTTWPLRWVAANVPPIMRLGHPVIASLLAWAWLGEMITLTHLIGGALTLAGVCGALLSRSGRDLSATARAKGARTARPRSSGPASGAEGGERGG